MKSFKIIVLSLLLFICNACKKDDKQKAQIDGTWELKSSTNGLTGKAETYSIDNGNLIIFSEANYQIFSDHKMIRSGTFKIVEETSLIHNQKGKRLIYDNEPDQIRTFLNIKGDELEIYIDAFDGSSALYVKK